MNSSTSFVNFITKLRSKEKISRKNLKQKKADISQLSLNKL